MRECFPTRVLLGSIQDPLVPLPDCSQRDITDDGSGTIFACLCNTDFCNDDDNLLGSQTRGQKTTRKPTNNARKTTRRPAPTTQRNFPSRRVIPTSKSPQIETPRRASRPSKTESQKALRSSCPQDFDLVDGRCYYLSNERVGWIEARKKCQAKKAVLLSLNSEKERKKVVEYIGTSTRRRRIEYWLGGNDIEEEGVWQWAGSEIPVPDFGWTEEPYNSYEENCLAWTVTARSSFGGSDGWHGSACCNSLRYICEV